MVVVGLAMCVFPARAQTDDADANVEDRAEEQWLQLAGWSPQFDLGFGVLTQSHDGESTVPTASGTTLFRDSGDSIISGFFGFGLNVLSPVVVESDWKPRVVLRSSVQLPISDGLISNRADLSFNRGNTPAPPPDFASNCPATVPGTATPTSTCSIQLRDRTTPNLLWTAGLGIDFLLPLQQRIFHVQPAIEYIGMAAQPEGSFERRSSGNFAPPPPAPVQSSSAVELLERIGDSETYHGVATSLTASADAYQEGPWVWSIFVNGRAAWFLSDHDMTVRGSNDQGTFIFVTQPAVDDVNEVHWQLMGGFSVRFDPFGS